MQVRGLIECFCLKNIGFLVIMYFLISSRIIIHRVRKFMMLGGGKHPTCTLDIKEKYGLYVVGIDVSQSELDNAPEGIYDETMCADIQSVQGLCDGDLVICRALLEHVGDTGNAIRSISTLLKDRGNAVIFVPSRNAVFARLNLMLPQKIKEKILYAIYPRSRKGQGFPSYYHQCTPNDFDDVASKNGLKPVDARYYYSSGYLSFLFPVHLIWRLYMVVFKYFKGKQAAETFSVVYTKKVNGQGYFN